MELFEFTLTAHGMTHLDEVPLGDVLKAGCDDSLVGSSNGRVHFIFGREADSLEAAIGSALLDLKKAGVSAWLESVESPEKSQISAAGDASAAR